MNIYYIFLVGILFLKILVCCGIYDTQNESHWNFLYSYRDIINIYYSMARSYCILLLLIKCILFSFPPLQGPLILYIFIFFQLQWFLDLIDYKGRSFQQSCLLDYVYQYEHPYLYTHSYLYCNSLYTTLITHFLKKSVK